jgi:HD superfamily phosphohydrolase
MMDALSDPLIDAGLATEESFKEHRRQVRLAALLHDVGHGPFSHVAEHVLNAVSGDVAKQLHIAESKLHEQVTLDIVEHSPEILSALRPGDLEAIKSILDTTSRRASVFGDVVSGSLDADKLDYLMRDAYFAGVRYGSFDLDRILDSLRVVGTAEDSHLAIDVGGVAPVEQLIVAKYHMTLQVYRHRIRRLTDLLLQRGFSAAVAEGVEPLVKLFTYPSSREPEAVKAYVDHYLSLDDASAFAILCTGSVDSTAVKIANALRLRHLPKEIVYRDLDDLKIGKTRATALRSSNGDTAVKLRTDVAAALEVDEDLVVVDMRGVEAKSPTGAGLDIDPEELLVLVGGLDEPFANRSRIFSQERRALRPNMYISVFAPVPEKHKTDQAEWRKSAEETVLGLIEGSGQ